jgi:hypothetical protein
VRREKALVHSGVKDRAGTGSLHPAAIGAVGAGGMGVFCKAEDLKLGRFVVLESLPDDSVVFQPRLRCYESQARTSIIGRCPRPA